MPDEPSPALGPVDRPFVEVRPLLRAVGIASDPRKMVLAAVGLFALVVGWSAIGWSFDRPSTAFVRVSTGSVTGPFPAPEDFSVFELAGRVAEPARSVVEPFAGLFGRGVDGPRWSQSALMAAWSVAVWGIFGGAIARIAVVQAADGPRVGVGTALRFAVGKSGSLIGAPLTPMVAVVPFVAGLAAFGLVCRLPMGIGPTIGTILGFVPLLIGLALALILLGLAVGWPLMHATVAAEGEDAADALSRSYSYVNQRFIRYVAHLLAAWGIGTVGLGIVTFLAGVVIRLTGWGVDLGGSSTAGDALRPWSGLVGWLVAGWSFSYFWSAASIIYLILRRDVDGAEWHDVYLPEHEADTFAGDEPSAPRSPAREVEAEVG